MSDLSHMGDDYRWWLAHWAKHRRSKMVEALGGEWWCALYLPNMNGACTYESRHHHDGEGCHWMVPADGVEHPLGAFIPEEANGE